MLRTIYVMIFIILINLAQTPATSAQSEKVVSLSVNTDNIVRHIDLMIYGQFLEHINHSVDGGIWGEVVWNRSFEEMPRSRRRPRAGAQQDSTNTPTVTMPSRWLITGDTDVSLDTTEPLNGQRCVKIVATTADAGISQNNFWLRQSDTLRGSLWLRGNAPDGLIVRLVSDDIILTEQTIAALNSEWKEFSLSLIPKAAADNATLQILTRGKAEVWIDQVSLMPDSFRANGGFRTDLLQAIADLKPSSIRWPGGGFVNGYRWKNGIGPQSKRITKGSDPLAFGMDEFMALCRNVGAEPIICVPLGPRDSSELAQWIQEAVDELEYCNGSAETTWGKVRVANGHPEPYNVKYWEIDNELYLTSMTASEYIKAAKVFSAALRQKDPNVTIIGCGGGGTNTNYDRQWTVKILDGDVSCWDILSLHWYENYRGPKDDAVKFRTGIDDFEKYYEEVRGRISRTGNPNMKVYESEWNYMSIDWRTGLYAGGVLNCFERNCDVVTMACPALFLRHASSTSWDNAFINFDHRTWFPAPNYVVMKLYRDHFVPNLLFVTGETGGLNVIATKTEDAKQVILKVVNPTDQKINARFDFQGAFKVTQAKLILIAPDSLTIRNSLDNPNAIKPVSKQIVVEDSVLRLTFPRWSVGVISMTK